MKNSSSGHSRVSYNGIKDDSGSSIAVVNTTKATYIPLIMFLAEKGDYKPRLRDATNATQFYGEQTFNTSSPYYLHPTMLAATTLSAGASALMMRIKVPGSTQARFRLNLEVINSDVATLSGSTVVGFRLVWTSGLSQYPLLQQDFGAGEPITNYRQGSVQSFGQYLGRTTVGGSASYASSTLYPILDLWVQDDGIRGNRIGFNLSPVFNAQGLQDTPVQAGGFLYNFSVLYKSTMHGASSAIAYAPNVSQMQFCLNPESTVPITANPPYTLDSQYSQNYLGSASNVGEISTPYIYQDNIDTILEMLWNLESAYDATIPSVLGSKWDLAGSAKNSYLINFMTGLMYDGSTKYNTFVVDTAGMFGGINFAQGLGYWASGGSDGFQTNPNGSRNQLASLFALDQGALNILSNLDNPEWALLDYLRNDFAAIIDTGYSMAVKRLIIKAHGARPDIAVVVIPFRYADFIVTVDPTPTVNGFLTPVAPNDTGTIGDNITALTTPNISGSTIPGSTVIMAVNGNTYTTTAGLNGYWSIDITTPLPSGTYTPALTITSPAGVTATGNGTPFTIRSAISCVGAIGSSGDLSITGNWNVVVDGVTQASNISSSQVYDWFASSPNFGVQDIPVSGNNWRVFLTADPSAVGSFSGYITSFLEIFLANGTNVGLGNASPNVTGHYTDTIVDLTTLTPTILSDLGIVIYQRPVPPGQPSYGDPDFISIIENRSPNTYQLRFINTHDFGGPMPYPYLVSVDEPSAPGQVLAAPSSFVQTSDGFTITLGPYPY